MKIQIVVSILCIGMSTMPSPASAQFGSTPPAVNSTPATGISSGVSGSSFGSVNSNPYSSTTGFYNPSVGSINYPTFGRPINTGGDFYNIQSGNVQLPMWKAPSGYYYPWCPRPSGFVYSYPLPVLIINNAAPNPAPALPPISTVLTDLEKLLEDSKKDGKVSERDYTNMIRRVKDLKSKERTLRIAGSGSLDTDDETQLRTDLDQVGSELSWRLNR